MAKATTKGAKASSNKTAAGSVEGAEEEEAKRQADEAARAEAEAKDAALSGLRGRLVDTLDDLASADKANALEARLKWVAIGDLLKEGRAMFTKPNSNEPNDVAFGRWIESQGLSALGQRPTRAAAMWLSDVYHTKEDLYNLFPQESKNGEPLRRSPRTLRDWVRDQMHTAFQIAWEADSDNIEIAAELSDKGEREKAAKGAMKNVYEALLEVVDSAEANVSTAREAMNKAKGAEERAKTQAAYNGACATLDEYTLLKDILDVHSADERTEYFIAWKPKMQSVSFKDADVDSAAERVFALLRTHPEFSAVYESLGALVEAEAAKVQEAEAAKEAAAAKEGAEAAGDDFDAGEEGADEFDPEAGTEEEDFDEGFEAEVDENFED